MYKVACVSPRSTPSLWEQETGGAPRVPKWGLVGQTLGWPLDGTGSCAGEEGAHRARLVRRAGVGGNAGADRVRTWVDFFRKGLDVNKDILNRWESKSKLTKKVTQGHRGDHPAEPPVLYSWDFKITEMSHGV